MTADQLISDAALLPTSDRLRIAQAIWDSLPEDACPAPGPEFQAELNRRMAKYRENPGSGMTIDELRARLEADRAK
jgi:putative addiction module component (TIGR02574 family)